MDLGRLFYLKAIREGGGAVLPLPVPPPATPRGGVTAALLLSDPLRQPLDGIIRNGAPSPPYSPPPSDAQRLLQLTPLLSRPPLFNGRNFQAIPRPQ